MIPTISLSPLASPPQVREESRTVETSRSRRSYKPKRSGPFKPTQFIVWKDNEKETQQHSKSLDELYHERRAIEAHGGSKFAIQDSQTALDSHESRLFSERAIAEARAVQQQSSHMQAERYSQYSHQQQQQHRQQYQMTSSCSTAGHRMRSETKALPEPPCPMCGNPDFHE